MLNKIALLRQWAERAANATVNYARTTYVAMWALILTCTIYGCMLIHSARPIAIKTQVMAATIGFIGAFFISLMDYHRLGQLWPLVGGGCIFLVGLTFVVGQSAIGGNAVADDVAWLNIFGYSFQPSELMKIGFIVTFSYHLSRVVEQGTLNTLSSVFLLGGHAFVPVILCNRQGDDGTALMFMVIFLLMFLLNNVNLGMGFALGLFAIFGMIRYRTEMVPIREMTYLFVTIGIAVINGLAMSHGYINLLIINALVIVVIAVVDGLFGAKRVPAKIVLGAVSIFDIVETFHETSLLN